MFCVVVARLLLLLVVVSRNNIVFAQRVMGPLVALLEDNDVGPHENLLVVESGDRSQAVSTSELHKDRSHITHATPFRHMKI